MLQVSKELLQQALDAIGGDDVLKKSWAKVALIKAITQPVQPPVPASQIMPPLAVNRDTLIDIIDTHLTAVYICTRVWDAWSVGTMTEHDFIDARDSEMSQDLAEAILNISKPLVEAAHPTDAERMDWLEQTKQRGHYCGIFNGNHLTRKNIDAAIAANKGAA